MPERGEFIGLKWLNFLDRNGILFAIRVKAGMNLRAEDGRNLSLRSLLAKCRGARKFRATFPSQGDVAALVLTFAAKRIKGGELLIVASNVADQNTLNAYRRRWSIECLFGDTKTRGLNLEDTGLQIAAKLSLLLAIVALALLGDASIACRSIEANIFNRLFQKGSTSLRIVLSGESR